MPWSESGPLSKLPLNLAGGGHRDALANREFTTCAGSQRNCLNRHKAASDIGVLIDSSLLKLANSSSSHGVSSAVNIRDAITVTFPSSAGGKTYTRVFYASTSDDLFAVSLAL